MVDIVSYWLDSDAMPARRRARPTRCIRTLRGVSILQTNGVQVVKDNVHAWAAVRPNL